MKTRTSLAFNFWLGFRKDSAAIIVAICFIVAVCVAGLIFGFKPLSPISIFANIVFNWMGLALLAMLFVLWLLWKHRPDSPFSFFRTNPALQFQLRRLVRALPVLLMLCIVSPAFSAMKSQIGTIITYKWDIAFINADIAIHGTDPWRLLHPIIGYPIITYTIGIVYQVWILLLYIFVPLMCVQFRTKRFFHQFIISYLLSWAIIGSILANLFASVGPCFLEAYTGDVHFRPLMDYLYTVDRTHPLMFLDVQQALLGWQQEGDTQLGRGISAMPSMHVSIALLFVLVARQLSIIWFYAFSIFFVLIFLGSIHTGYHYAVDGYASIILTLAIWFCVGWFLQRRYGPMNYTVNQRT